MKFVEQWVDALKSDAYDQNFDHEEWCPLRTEDNKFSALGVLCNIHAMNFPEHAKTEMDPTEYMGCSYVLPYSVRRLAGIDTVGSFNRPFRFDGKIFNSVEDMDKAGIPFLIIADAIKERFINDNQDF